MVKIGEGWVIAKLCETKATSDRTVCRGFCTRIWHDARIPNQFCDHSDPSLHGPLNAEQINEFP